MSVVFHRDGLDVQDAHPADVFGIGLTFATPTVCEQKSEAHLGTAEVEDLRDVLTDWLRTRGRS